MKRFGHLAPQLGALPAESGQSHVSGAGGLDRGDAFTLVRERLGRAAGALIREDKLTDEPLRVFHVRASRALAAIARRDEREGE